MRSALKCRSYRSRSRSVAALLLPPLLCGLLLTAGCRPGKKDADEASKTLADSGIVSASGTVLETAYAKVQPAALDITADADQVAASLTQYIAESNPIDETMQRAATSEGVQKLIKGADVAEMWNHVVSETFTAEDARHIRNAILLRDFVQNVVVGARGEAERANLVYDGLCERVLLEERSEDDLALTPFSVLMFGQGTPRDRAWLFADALRQLRMMAVLVRPADGADPEAWLIGVPIENDLLLFDPHVGHSPTDRETWRLSKLDLETLPQPQRSADWSKLRIDLIGTSSQFAPRMQTLEESLSGDRTVVLSLPLDRPAGSPEPGAIDAIALAAESWGRPIELGVWAYPETQRDLFAENRFRSSDYVAREERLRLPLRRASADDDEGNEKELVPQLPDQKSGRKAAELQGGWRRTDLIREGRLQHLRGDYEAAKRTYQAVRSQIIQTLQELPAENQEESRAALNNVTFWIGQVQAADGDPGTAISTWRQYLRQFASDATWNGETIYALGHLYASQERFDRAKQTWEALPFESAMVESASYWTAQFPGDDKPVTEPEQKTTPEPKPEPDENSAAKTQPTDRSLPIRAPRP